MRPWIVVSAIFLQTSLATGAEPQQPARIELVAGGESMPQEAVAGGGIVNPFGVAFDGAVTLYFVEMLGHRVRRLGPGGQIATLAGTGRAGHGGDDGPAAQPELNGPHSLASSSNAAGMHSGSSIGRARSAPWLGRATRGTQATAGMRSGRV